MTAPQNEPQRASDTVAALVGSFFDHAEHPAPFKANQSTRLVPGTWFVLDAHNDSVCECGADKESATVIAAALNALAANATLHGSHGALQKEIP